MTFLLTPPPMPSEPDLPSEPLSLSEPEFDTSGFVSEKEEDNRVWEQAFQDMDKVFPTPTFESRGRLVHFSFF